MSLRQVWVSTADTRLQCVGGTQIQEDGCQGAQAGRCSTGGGSTGGSRHWLCFCSCSCWSCQCWSWRRRRRRGRSKLINSQKTPEVDICEKRDKKTTTMASAASSSSSVLKDVQVAIVGAGVAGLQCAQTLLKAGVTSVVVLEATSVVGGYETSVVATHCVCCHSRLPFVGWLPYWL